jgi:hypothetical protein
MDAMDGGLRYRAAGGHLLSGLTGLVAVLIGIRWVLAGGDPVAIPATVIVLSLLVLTPPAVRRGWSSRGEFIDLHMEAACRFLTSVGLAGVVIIGIPAAISPFLPSGTELWSSLLVLPYLGALALPVAWTFLSTRAAIIAFRGADRPYPEWTVPDSFLSH